MATTFKPICFDTDKTTPATVFLPANRLESLRAEAMKSGYEQGYEAACAELDAARVESTSLLASKIQELTLGVADARKAVLDTLQPLIEGMVDTILPAISDRNLGNMLATQIKSVAMQSTDKPVKIRSSPGNIDEIQRVVSQIRNLPTPLEVVPDPTLGPCEIVIKSMTGERLYDPDTALQAIKQKVATYFSQLKEPHSDG